MHVIRISDDWLRLICHVQFHNGRIRCLLVGGTTGEGEVKPGSNGIVGRPRSIWTWRHGEYDKLRSTGCQHKILDVGSIQCAAAEGHAAGDCGIRIGPKGDSGGNAIASSLPPAQHRHAVSLDREAQHGVVASGHCGNLGGRGQPGN